jgi:hypothetical protein
VPLASAAAAPSTTSDVHRRPCCPIQVGFGEIEEDSCVRQGRGPNVSKLLVSPR